MRRRGRDWRVDNREGLGRGKGQRHEKGRAKGGERKQVGRKEREENVKRAPSGL